MKKVINAVLLSFILFLCSCSNMVVSNSQNLYLEVGESNARFVKQYASRTNNIPSDATVLVTCDLISGTTITQKVESTIPKLNEVKFNFLEVPFNRYIVVVKVYYQDNIIFEGKTREFSVSEYETEQNLDITLYPYKAVIEYDKNGGTIEEGYSLPDTYTMNSTVVLPSLRKANHDFIGWYTKPNGEGEKIKKLGKECYVGDIKLYAYFEEIKTVKDVEFITDNKTYLIDYKDTVTLKCDTPSSKIFYSLDNGSFNEYTSPIELTSDTLLIKAYATDPVHNLTGKTTEKTISMIKYEVSYDAKGFASNPPSSIGFKKGDSLLLSSLPTISNTDLNFKYWSYEGEEVNTDLVINKNITLTAVWQEVLQDVVITSKTGDNVGQKKVELTTPETDTSNIEIYYTTDNSTPNRKSNLYSTPFVVSTDTTVKAISYTKDNSKYQSGVSEKNYVTVTLQSDYKQSSIAYDTYVLEQGETLVSSSLPQFKEVLDLDKNFISWKDETGLPVSSNIPINKNTTLKAYWGVKDVTFNISNTDIQYDSTVELTCPTQSPAIEIYYTTDKTDPTKENGTKYTTAIEVGKNNISEIRAIAYATDGSLQESNVVKATYTLQTYNVHFNTNDSDTLNPVTGSMDNQTFIINETKALTPSSFSKSGFAFEHWTLTPTNSGTSYVNESEVTNLTSTPNDTVELYAQWTDVPPQGVTNFQAVQSGDVVRVTWTNPTDKDLAKVVITCEGTSLNKEVTNGSETIDITLEGDALGKGTYNFKAQAVDKGGNNSDLVSLASPLLLPKFDPFTIESFNPSNSFGAGYRVYITGANLSSITADMITSSNVSIDTSSMSCSSGGDRITFTITPPTSPASNYSVNVKCLSDSSTATFEVRELQLADIVLGNDSFLSPTQRKTYKGYERKIAIVYKTKTSSSPAMGIGVKNQIYPWCGPDNTTGINTKFSTSRTNGKGNWQVICDADPKASERSNSNYPLHFYAMEDYYFSLDIGTYDPYFDTFYIPAIDELKEMYNAISTNSTLYEVFNDTYGWENYSYQFNVWSSSQSSSNTQFESMSFSDGSVKPLNKTEQANGLPITELH